MNILGISAFHRDAAAALLVNGRPVAAIQEDRFTKRLEDESFPIRAARACLAQGGIQARDLDRVVFYEKPLRKFERVLATQLMAFPRSARPFGRSMFLWLGDRLWMKNRIVEELELDGPDRVLFTEHQLAHAASAFFPSPFDEAAVLTLDDAGEWATTALVRGSGTDLELLGEVRFPHSLGIFVSAVAQYLGLEPGTQDHLLQSLAAHGTPRFVDKFDGLIKGEEGGAFSIDQGPFRYGFDQERLFGEGFEQIFGPARLAAGALRFESPDTHDADIAASLQHVLEARVLDLCRELHRRVPSDALCLAGSLAENRVLASRILRDGPFERLFIPPAPGDAGAALGAALYVHHVAEGGSERFPQADPFLGLTLDARPEEGARELSGEENAETTVLKRLLDNQIVGWVRGRMEFGARSLGHRSILADPRPPDARARLLGSVQHGEPFLACRLAVPAECADEYFELPSSGAELPLRFAQLSLPARDRVREFAPSGVLPDGTVWPQLVDSETDPVFHRLLHRFGESAGVPMLLHSTFALRGSPMVRIEPDAVASFRRTQLDCLIVGENIYEDTSEPAGMGSAASSQ